MGGLFAAGHLFTSAIPAQAPALIGLGAAAGLLAQRIRRKRAVEGRASRLLRELPTVADTLALSVLAGESVGGAIERFVRSSAGVAAEELRSGPGRPPRRPAAWPRPWPGPPPPPPTPKPGASTTCSAMPTAPGDGWPMPWPTWPSTTAPPWPATSPPRAAAGPWPPTARSSP